MLKEKIHYSDRLPLNLTIVEIEEYPIHFHDDLEILFVLDGSIVLKNGYYNYEMNQGDIFILNDREIHSFQKTSEKNMVLMFQLDIEYFIQHYPILNNSFFVTDVNDPDDKDLEVLRELLASAIMQSYSGELGYEQKLIEIAHNILACLMENFQYFAIEDGRFVNETKNKSNKILAARMNRVSDYLYENYSRRITLQEIANKEHLSIYHLSHVIKQSTGLSYKELLGFIRVEESEKLLLGTDMSISSISDSIGFSATRYYVEHFKKWFGLEPQVYRERYKGKVSSRKTLSVMNRVNKLEAGDVIKKYYPDVYYDHFKKDKVPNLVLDLDIATDDAENILETQLYKKLTRPELSYASQLLQMMVSLSEPVVASGPNYIATADANADYISILLYNFDTEYEKDADILVRINELSGRYNLKRVSLTYDNIKAQKETDKDSLGKNYRRKGLFRRLASTPLVDNSVVTAVNILNIVVSLSNLSGELLLLDKIDE